MELTPRVLVGTPMYGGMCTSGYVHSLLDLQKEFSKLGWHVELVSFMNHPIITKARNTLVDLFLKDDFTHLLFIDADVSVRPSDVVKMIQADKPFIGGLYPLKEINWESVYAAVKNDAPVEDLVRYASRFVFDVFEGEDARVSSPDSLREVKYLGTGYMLLKREVFEKLESIVPSYRSVENNPEFSQENGEYTKEYFSFAIDPKTKKYLPEDFNFCEKWLSLGEKVYLAQWAYAQHIGTYVFG